MPYGHIFQALQLILVMLTAILFVYHFVRFTHFYRPIALDVYNKSSIKNILLSIRSLSVHDYECFQKLDIWRYYRFR